ncbi:MAG: hypothetical protein EBS19_01000 [Spirochaetia bacterium]|nr:hypothetical protein [Spirochaetia bacterium]
MKKQKKLIEDEKDDLNTKGKLEDSKKNDVENEEFEIDTSSDYRNLQSVVTYEDEDYIYSCNLNEKIDGIFQESRWSVISPSKKIPKDLIPLIFQDILKELEGTEFSMVEKFVAICDYTAINYQKAYESIHMKYKELIVQEMDKKYGILSKKGIKKIF